MQFVDRPQPRPGVLSAMVPIENHVAQKDEEKDQHGRFQRRAVNCGSHLEHDVRDDQIGEKTNRHSSCQLKERDELYVAEPSADGLMRLCRTNPLESGQYKDQHQHLEHFLKMNHEL